ncbi:MAG: glycosyltransferase [Prevotellaceae bacterium]|jgi:hypothetical protein|nr:glycosyltransferase [Prevotellaceae bacterium]
MKRIKIYFADFWGTYNKTNNFIINILKEKYEVELDAQNPEYLFCSYYGTQHWKYSNAVKIYWTGEMDTPDFNKYDYAISSAPLVFGDRYLRSPVFATARNTFYTDFLNKDVAPNLAKRKFCNFVYSNSRFAHPMRKIFFERLSQYKKVDAGGRFLNNMGGQYLEDKIAFLKEYKFTLAIENSSVDGYTTEKLMDPIRAVSMPIYWGNKLIANDFNTDSFVNVMDYNSIDEAVEEIIRLDNDDEAYLKKLSQKWMLDEQVIDYKSKLSTFLENIIEKDFGNAKRVQSYGMMLNLERAKSRLSDKLFNTKAGKILIGRYLKSDKWLKKEMFNV